MEGKVNAPPFSTINIRFPKPTLSAAKRTEYWICAQAFSLLSTTYIPGDAKRITKAGKSLIAILRGRFLSAAENVYIKDIKFGWGWSFFFFKG